MHFTSFSDGIFKVRKTDVSGTATRVGAYSFIASGAVPLASAKGTLVFFDETLRRIAR